MKRETRILISLAFKEDIGKGDITTKAVLKDNVTTQAHIVAREKGILCGIDMIRMIFKLVDKKVKVATLKHDGARVKKGTVVCKIRGPVYSILKAERVVLNYISYLSGISTTTQRYVQKVKGTKTRIYDTRKTTPGYRMLEKYAVVTGGGCNQRIGLFDQVLIKDNHLHVVGKKGCKDIPALIQRVRRKIPRRMKIQIEADSLSLLRMVLPAHPDMILLDNMNKKTLKKAITLIRKESRHVKKAIQIEASGGITLRNVRRIANLGVDRISIGAITHSAHNLDFSLELV